MTLNHSAINTRGELRASGYRHRTVKDELRANLIERLRRKEDIFPGVLGYERSVIPHLQQALLSRHDFILLGLRGQAKTRLLRMLPGLLDPQMPIVAGSEINDHPFAPISKHARQLVEEKEDETPIEWVPREARYGEKLATPDTTIADLIGDIDPIKAANQRLTYADEEVIHFGIIPRTNRGIFAINELPDLQPRIQVGLLNILEEQDIQIRGFNIRFPLDVLMVFSANPEDYTNRGSIITPLKDRIESQILTHYPRDVKIGMEITRQEAWQDRTNGSGESVRVTVPHFIRQIIEEIAFEARASEYVDQKSGVSVRVTKTALEDLISAAERRSLLNDEDRTTIRISDLMQIETALTGKIELVYEGEQEGAQNVARLLIGRGIKNTFMSFFPDPSPKKGTGNSGRNAYRRILKWFQMDNSLSISHDMPFTEYAKALDQVDGLGEFVAEHASPSDPQEKATTMEFVLEALHQHSLIGKELLDEGGTYSDIMGSMLSSLDELDDLDDEDFDDEGFYG